MRRKLFYSLLFVMLIWLTSTNSVYAADHSIDSNTDISILSPAAGDTITIESGSNITLSSPNANTIYDVSIICEDSVSLTIQNLNIQSSTGCALEYESGTNVLSLATSSVNTFSSAASHPGIRVEGTTVLTIDGTGQVATTGGSHGSGIGGGEDTGAGTININSGTIVATAGRYGSGIGGGEQGSGGHINIYNGHITATGNTSGAGIGGGSVGSSGIINIYNGTIIATGSTNGAGIGSGSLKPVNEIYIHNGNITVKGISHGAGIGGGSQSPGGVIQIYDGVINVTPGQRAAAIGGGFYTDCGAITITGGTIDSGYRSGNNGYGAGIGSGYYGLGGTVRIEGGAISARGGSQGGAGIGGGAYDASVGITITGGTVEGRGVRGAGIGSGWNKTTCADITLTGGIILAYGRYNDIGSGRYSSTPQINISGSAALFLLGNRSSTVNGDPTHRYFNHGEYLNNSAYRYAVPIAYNATAYAWLPYARVDYVSGAHGSLIDTINDYELVPLGYYPVNDPGITVDTGYTYLGWSDGTTVSTNVEDFTILGPTTLTATYHIPTTGVSIDIPSATLTLGDIDTTNDTILLAATLQPSDATNENIVWSIDDSTIATIDSTTGLVTAVSSGVATVTATTVDGGHTDTGTITVLQEATGVSIDIASAVLILGDADTTNDTILLAETVLPSDAANRNVVWSIDDSSIATINTTTGLVTAVSSGITTVTVTTDSGGHTANSTIRVVQRVTDVILDKHDLIYQKNITDTLVCDVIPHDADVRTVTWQCDNANVVTYTILDSSTIQFTTHRAGIANIVVTTDDGGYQDTFTITVHNPDNDPNAKNAHLSAELLDSSDSGVSGYKFTLYSDPISATTDSTGSVSFNNIAYDYHTLVILDSSDVEVRRCDLTFTPGTSTGYSEVGDDILLTYTTNTSNIHLLFRINNARNNIQVAGVNFTMANATSAAAYSGYVAINPNTGEDTVDDVGFWQRIVDILTDIFTNHKNKSNTPISVDLVS